MINFSEFGTGGCELSPSVKIPSYETVTVDEMLQLKEVRYLSEEELKANPLANADIVTEIVGIFMRSRVDPEWTVENVRRLPLNILVRAFAFCAAEMQKVPEAEALAKELGVESPKAAVEIVEAA
ncbi:hypothetical protein [Pseudanabaena sp. PCC 6802]|uniref:hypothetical protein n=1 Tax=Pseudanabaena sp. PCC 6802 TaxID=118173 RepID=UPI00037A40E8|nr:hypothetical protein [Pseudanabaena sp. PCC 6802]